MKAKELKDKNLEELKKLLVEYQNKLKDFRIAMVANKIKNFREIREIKKTIARILTFICQKEH